MRRAAILSVVLAVALVSTALAAPAAAAEPDDVLLFTDSVVLHAAIAIDNAVPHDVTTVGFPGVSLFAAPDVLAPVDVSRYGTVVIALGNNILDRTLMRSRTSAILELFPRDTRIIWVTSGPWSSRQRTFNAMLRDVRNKWANLELAEWELIRTSAHTQPDGIHLSYQGIARMATLVAGHINGTAPIPNRATIGHLDGASSTPHGVRLGGWAIDLDTEQSIPVEFTVDGRSPNHGSSTAMANRPRADVDAVWNHGAEHGFAATVPMVRDGQHSICAFARDTETGEPAELGCRSVTVRQQPQGTVEYFRLVRGKVQVQGWAYDPTTDAPVLIRLRADGRRIGSPYAERPRPDVPELAAAGRSPNHGYRFTVPVPPGTSELCVWAIDPQGGRNQRLDCLSV